MRYGVRQFLYDQLGLFLFLLFEDGFYRESGVVVGQASSSAASGRRATNGVLGKSTIDNSLLDFKDHESGHVVNSKKLTQLDVDDGI